jgi:hypothetical protein
MRTLLAIAGLLTGLVLWTAPAMAHDAHRMAADKPIVTAEKDVPTGPRICLFSQNGKRADPAPGESTEQLESPQNNAAPLANNDSHQEAAAPLKIEVAQSPPGNDATVETSQQPSDRQPADRVCDTDIAAPVPPHG